MTSPSPTSRVVPAASDNPFVRNSLLPPGERVNLDELPRTSDLRCWLEVELIVVVPEATRLRVALPAPSLFPARASAVRAVSMSGGSVAGLWFFQTLTWLPPGLLRRT